MQPEDKTKESLDASGSDRDEEEVEKAIEKEMAKFTLSNRDEKKKKSIVKDSGHKSTDDETKNRQFLQEHSRFQDVYMSQHVNGRTNEALAANIVVDTMWMSGNLAAVVPTYRNGKNPNYFEEYFSSISSTDYTNTAECKAIVNAEYESRRWSYCQHLWGYHNGTNQETNQKIDTVELWRRFRFRQPPPHVVMAWYLDKKRKVGDLLPIVITQPPYQDGLYCLSVSFSNSPIVATPKTALHFGSVHVAVGFVDLGLLLDSQIQSQAQDNAHLLFRGFEASPFAVAKSLILWEMIKSRGMKAKWIVQVWFSTVWSKRASNEFLAATRRIFASESFTEGHQSKVGELVRHWSQSKGVGLKKLVKRCSRLRRESSNALFFASKHDRVDMIRYFLTGEFGLLGEEPCSASIIMFDCPPATVHESAISVFTTMLVKDVVTSEHWNGSYFQTAEKVKESRISTLMEHAQKEKIKVKISVSILGPSNASAVKEIAALQPKTISWSNIIDYMDKEEFHSVAKACSATAIHFGYSMNWPSLIYGTSLIDYPKEALGVIRQAEQDTTKKLKKLCGRNRRVFLTPIQHNPLNTTSSFLAERCHRYWVKYFFENHNATILDSGMLDHANHNLGGALTAVACTWTYNGVAKVNK